MKPGLFSLLAVLVFTLSSCGSTGLPKLAVSSYSEKTVETGIPLRMDIDCGNGDIEVYSWNKNGVKLEITKTVRGREEKEELLKRLEDIRVDMAGEDGKIYLKSGFKGGGGQVEGQTDFKIYLPKKTSEIKIVQKNGSLHFLDDFNGAVTVEADRLDLDINRLKGILNCNLDEGDVNLSSGELGDGSGIRVTNGNIRIRAAFESSGNYSIETGYGMLDLCLPEDTNAVFDTYGMLEAVDFHGGENPSKFRLGSKVGKISIQKF